MLVKIKLTIFAIVAFSVLYAADSRADSPPSCAVFAMERSR